MAGLARAALPGSALPSCGLGKGKSMGKCTQKEYKAEPESNCLYHFFFFSFFLPEQRLAVKLPELISDEQRCV